MFIIGSFYPTFFVDRVGRRQPMMWGSLGLGISMMMIAILLSFKGTSVEKGTSSAAITFFFTYMLIFGGSVNCIPWVYVPEILPLHARAKGTAIGISSNWIWNFFVVMITPVILNRLAWKGYLIFMCTNFAFIPLVYFCYPETANLTLEEIDFIFADETVSSVKLSKEMRKERVKGGRRESFVQPTGRTGSVADRIEQAKYAMADHAEESEPKASIY
jgi:MFS family permease